MFSDYPQRTGNVLTHTTKKKKIKKETLALPKRREQLYMNVFWLIPGSKAEPQGVSEEVVPRKDTEIFSEPQ